MYKYRVKGKELNFDTSKLNDKDKTRWNKLGKIGKLRMIESYNLSDKSGVPGDYIEVKTIKDKPQNERLAKLRIEEQKKTELDKIKQSNNLDSSDSIDDVEDVMNDEQKILFKDDLSKLKKDNQNPTISDLEKVYASKIEQLTANEIGTINAKNVDTINASNVNKLMLDVKKLTDELVNPLRPVLENLIERHGDDRRVLELADRNDIQGLMDELKKLNDEATTKEIKESIDSLKSQLDSLTGVNTNIANIYTMVNENKTKLDDVLNKIKNEPNPIKRIDEFESMVNSMKSKTESNEKQFNELKKLIEKMMDEQLTKEQVQEIINDEALFEDLKNELKSEYGDQITPLINNIDELKGIIDERTIVDDEMENYNQVVDAVRTILYNNPKLGEVEQISKEDIMEMLKNDKAELNTKIDSTINYYVNELLRNVSTKVDANTKELIANIVSGTLQEKAFKDKMDEFNNAFDEKLVEQMMEMYKKLISEGEGTEWEIDIGNGQKLPGSTWVQYEYKKGEDKGKPANTPTRNLESDFPSDFRNQILPALLRGARPTKVGVKKQTGKELSQYGFSQFMNFASNVLNEHKYLDRKSGSLISKIKGKLTSDDVKKDLKELKNEVKSLKDELKSLKEQMNSKSKDKLIEIEPKPKDKSKDKFDSKFNNFLDDIVKRKDLKHVELPDERPKMKDEDEGIVSNLKDIMRKRREDIEPDEYSEDDDVDWAAGINKRKILTYAQFKELFG